MNIKTKVTIDDYTKNQGQSHHCSGLDIYPALNFNFNFFFYKLIFYWIVVLFLNIDFLSYEVQIFKRKLQIVVFKFILLYFDKFVSTSNSNSEYATAKHLFHCNFQLYLCVSEITILAID